MDGMDGGGRGNSLDYGKGERGRAGNRLSESREYMYGAMVFIL